MIILKVVLTLIASIAGAYLYRAGGIGKPFPTKLRDWGVSAITLILLLMIGGRAVWWTWGLCFIGMWAALSTYWDTLTKLWRGDESEYWENWLLHGLGVGLAALPFAWVSGNWVGFTIRTILVGGLICGWSEMISNDEWEERGRGWIIVITTPLLLI